MKPPLEDAELRTRAKNAIRELETWLRDGKVDHDGLFAAIVGDDVVAGGKVLCGGLARAHVRGAAAALRWIAESDEEPRRCPEK